MQGFALTITDLVAYFPVETRKVLEDIVTKGDSHPQFKEMQEHAFSGVIWEAVSNWDGDMNKMLVSEAYAMLPLPASDSEVFILTFAREDEGWLIADGGERKPTMSHEAWARCSQDWPKKMQDILDVRDALQNAGAKYVSVVNWDELPREAGDIVGALQVTITREHIAADGRVDAAILRALNTDVPTIVRTTGGVSDIGCAQLAEIKGLIHFFNMGPGVTGQGLEEFANHPSLRMIYLAGANVGDADLRALASVPHLVGLVFNSVPITDRGMEQISQLEQLETLSRFKLAITDQGMESVSNLVNLKFIGLHDIPVGDAALDHLGGLSNLERVELRQTRVTPDGVEKLQEKLPECSISRR